MSEAEDFEFRLRMEREADQGGIAIASHPLQRGSLMSMSPAPQEQPGVLSPNLVPRGMDHAEQFLKQAALPTAGAAAGIVLGGMTGPLAPFAIPALEAGGSLGGEYLNQQFGITPKSNTQLLLSAVAPPLLRGGMKALQMAPRLLPGASAALQEEAASQASQMPAKLIAPPSIPSSQLFAQVAQGGNTALPTPNIQAAARKLLTQQQLAKPSLQHTEITKLANDFLGTSQLGIQEVQANAQALNKSIRDRTKDDIIKGAYKLLRGSLEKDLEAASANLPEASILKQAWKAYRRESAVSDLTDIIETKGIKKVGEFLDQVNPNAIGNWIKDNEFFKKSITGDELKAIQQTLTDWSKIPTVPIKRGAPIGSGRRLGLIAAGAGAGGALGDSMGAAVGALAADKGAELIARAITSPTGRKVLLSIVRAKGGRFGQDEAGLLSAALAAGSGAGRSVSEQGR